MARAPSKPKSEPAGSPGAPKPERLNAAQLDAVTHEGGPLAVLAGPGTGKTRVIVHRIAHLLSKGVEPERIVAVTFTVKAARQMQDRLAALLAQTPLGAGSGAAAQRVNVHTFHGLGLRLVNRFPDVLGMPGDLDLIDVPEQLAILRDLVTRHAILPESAGQGREAVVQQCQKMVELFHNQGTDPDEAPQWASRWLTDIERLAAAGAPAPEVDALRYEQRRFAEFARLYQLFCTHTRERAMATFGDLLTLPCRLLRDHAREANVVRQDWQHFVVDEFQDVNAAQIRLLSLLCPPESSPDLCVVGDDDQAIYGFRGSDDRAFQKFANLYPGHKLVQLTDNHRSSRRVLGIANVVIGHATDRFAPDKVIVAAGHLADDPTPVRYIKLEEEQHDGRVIGALILAQLAREPDLPWDQYAVIARSHGDLDRVAGALRLEGIPVSRKRDATWREDQAVQDALAWIQLLCDDRDTGAARRLLIRPPCSQPVDRVLQWLKEYHAATSRVTAEIDGAPDPGGVLPFIATRAPGDAAVTRLMTVYTELRTIAAQVPADEAVFRILKVSGVASSELLGTRAQTQRVHHLVRLFRLARVKQSRLPQPRDLRAFWAYWQDLPLRDEGDPGDQVESLADGEDEPETEGVMDPDVRTGRGVQLLTAHGSKGLEFDTVFVPRVGPPHGYPKSARDDEPITPGGFIDRAGDTRDVKTRGQAEERRLFYVACTRAERRLVLLSRYPKSASSAVNFIDELVRTPPTPGLTDVQTEADALAGAARSTASGLGAALATQSADLAAAATRFEHLQEARSSVRHAAADALSTIDRAGSTPADLDQAAARLERCAAELTAIAHVEATGRTPEWAGSRAGEEAAKRLGALAEICAMAEPPELGGIKLTKRLAPPLRLSYSKLEAYIRCPRCAYLRYVEDVPDAPRDEASLGQVIHGVLQTFYDRWRAADADGQPTPGLPDLLSMGKSHWARALKRDQEADPEDRRTLLAQLELTFTKLHDPDANIVELERQVELPYPHNGHTHTLNMRIDRIDDLGDGRYRLIDYKSGGMWAKHIEPKADDLQLGLYALALDHLYGDGGQVEGVAEYWVLAGGQRGQVNLADLKRKRITDKINKVIDGMMSGDWPKAGKCDEGLCAVYNF